MKLHHIAVVLVAAGVAAGCAQSGYHNIDTTIALEEPWVRTASLEQRAGNGDGFAARVLGNMYYWGQEVERDEQKAAQWWRRGAESGDEVAQINLERYEAGQPVSGELHPSVGREYWAIAEESVENAWAEIEAEYDFWVNELAP